MGPLTHTYEVSLFVRNQIAVDRYLADHGTVWLSLQNTQRSVCYVTAL